MANDGEMKGDKLVLRGLKFHGYHGVKEEEKKLGQKFVIDIDAWMDLHQIAKEVVEGTPQNLLETVAQLIASATLTNHSRISAIRVQVQKPHVSVPGHIDFLGVEITRYRSTEGPK
ncbi:hypothetical protein DCAR_0310264 [Daucus carota subsp. sativus]|uniref:dihydroneopterin aldolase n=1 Tax=Daucus carota subsp. sativus TaxID=79200 RepID=A0AAF0WLW7_DAUCS|nr:hypothetical protein DCAR_0310264 [Daucus carota subsp. sativus]